MRLSKRVKIILVVFVTIVTISTLVEVFFLREYNDFNILKKQLSKDASLFYNFVDKYPKSRYIEEAWILKIEEHNDIVDIRNYLSQYPDGKYAAKIKALKNKLWQEQIKRYQELTQAQKDNKAISFFRDILIHMKKEDNHKIYVNFKKNISLKDLNDYGEETISRIDLMSEPDRLISENIIPLKNNFSEGNISRLEKIVLDGIQKSFESIFVKGFVDIVPKKGIIARKDLVISIDYSIHNQEDKESQLPEIWEFSSDKEFHYYLLGIVIQFKLKLEHPLTGQSYEFNIEGQAGENINNINDINQGYEMMTRIAFTDFAKQISHHFGLKNKYFKTDKN